MNDHYKTLEVDPTASPEEVRQAFCKMALKYHPDRNDSPDAVIRIKEVYEAYAMLRNEDTKAEYDTQKYESQRFQARTSTVDELQRTSQIRYNLAFVTDPKIIIQLQKQLEEMKRGLIETQKDLDEEFQDYAAKGKSKIQKLQEEMKNLASEML